MEKVVRNGKVAVLVSYGYGAGWYSSNSEHPQLLFHPKLVEMVEMGKREEITEEWIEENMGIADVYVGGRDGLTIEWLPVGTPFRIEEHDGYETLITSESMPLVA